ncbi:Apt2p [Saccharomyces cerevisiae AWRI796]|nr:Apt2p [Saccharomyces cerevisiae AWRI796]
MASTCISKISSWSNFVNVIEAHSPGNFPTLLIGTNPTPNASARDGPNRRPLASIPAIKSIFSLPNFSSKCVLNVCTNFWNSVGLPIIGKKILKLLTLYGKVSELPKCSFYFLCVRFRNRHSERRTGNEQAYTHALSFFKERKLSERLV